MTGPRLSSKSWISASLLVLLIRLITACENGNNQSKLQPFANNNGQIPPRSEYSGPLFQLSHNYPKTTRDIPEKVEELLLLLESIPINQENVVGFVNVFKDIISLLGIETLIFDYDNWDAEEEGWFNQPWLGPIRESIHGMYEGSTFPASTFQDSGLEVTMTTYVLPYYDLLGGFTLGQVWGETALEPALDNNEAQFPERTIIVKLAFTTASPEDWPVLEGTAVWPIYVATPESNSEEPEVVNVYLLQLDIIYKDTIVSPETGWVFMTLVYDKSVEGDVWDKMVPLGAMIGNDPNVNSAIDPNAPLSETFINPDAPEYSTATLGWGGRLSGPNDGAVVEPASINGEIVPRQPASSCMSCHGTAEIFLESFILPGPSDPPGTDQPTVTDQGILVLFEPGSEQWDRYFQNRSGTEPQDPGQIALDYDLVFAFKSLPAWENAINELEEERKRPYHGIEMIMP